ncbi:class I SAM-dependent methyltransferase [Amycolatopsis jiangsuensis]|uniref:Ubiquinone/menaquinone biosynthesis C-methylase UbiE n=1 Tax=Amycolatopsis jiangsuensis TaxID=1181879 RepID=A0A840IZW0_9PSEU|nr:class I SAM-dependent methyltransferase [Amycolatopsis jiangsuensis]MBB4686732.1 ubiquinone/menaquinone biosynthesis C-methylase UbiE [Amycolatopsis jiangsuensis]
MSSLPESGLPRGEVPAAFDRDAAAYDRLIGLNPGYHRHLRISARRLLAESVTVPRILDAGCGTGASTAALLAVAPRARITAIDASAEMLARAKTKSWPGTVNFVHTPVEDLATVHGRFDAVFSAYLLRNLADPDTQLRSLRGLLRPGGRFAAHEYSVRDSRRAQWVWKAVCAGIIIPIGRIATGDATLYQHLRRSVLTFDGVGELCSRLSRAGFADVRTGTMPGWQRGIVHTVLGTAT